MLKRRNTDKIIFDLQPANITIILKYTLPLYITLFKGSFHSSSFPRFKENKLTLCASCTNARVNNKAHSLHNVELVRVLKGLKAHLRTIIHLSMPIVVKMSDIVSLIPLELNRNIRRWRNIHARYNQGIVRMETQRTKLSDNMYWKMA